MPCETFTVEVLTLVGLIRYHVLFVIDLETRRVEILGIVHNPGGVWMAQVARNLVDTFDGFLKDHRYPIVDRDTLFTSGFRAILKDGGVETVRLPARSPNLNAFAECFVLTIKSECLNHIVPRVSLVYGIHGHDPALLHQHDRGVARLRATRPGVRPRAHVRRGST